MYYRNANCAVVVYDITSSVSLVGYEDGNEIGLIETPTIG